MGLCATGEATLSGIIDQITQNTWVEYFGTNAFVAQ